MFQNFDPKERKAILIIFIALLGGAIFFSGGEALFTPEDPFQHRSERFGSPIFVFQFHFGLLLIQPASLPCAPVRCFPRAARAATRVYRGRLISVGRRLRRRYPVGVAG